MKRQQKTAFFCQNCGYESPKWVGKCPGCGEWNRFAEEPVKSADSRLPPEFRFDGKPRPIDAVEADEKARVKTGIGEMDRVLGGGIVAGSAILVGGDPGIGKSTLLLQVMHRLASAGKKVLYVSGEESASQIRLRADRVGASSKSLYVLVEVSLENILTHIKEVAPDAIVIDSIQTVYSSMLTSAPGSVGQVREASERFIILSKKTGIPVFLVGHVTKDGSIAGPKVLEHMVDTVLYFEGDSGHSYRIIRGIKNRFGPTNEIGVFEMRDRGLVEVSNPSEYFLTERPEGMAGSVVVAAIEGTRPILVEIQSLVASTSFGMPRRTAIGVDGNRLSLLVAVLDKIGGLHLGNHDIFVNVAGGVKLAEPAADLGVVAAVASSFLDRSIDPKTVVFGEVGLTGEIRGINQMEVRIREAARMGFARCVLPRTQLRGLDRAASIELIR
ncbi:MAG TPA: DNA repair protein RadA, partial [Syntrophales bacterium]|nr:DNA repair protein RadA [Syntrophales bacterium]